MKTLDYVPINTAASSLRIEIEAQLLPGEWKPFWRQVQREAKKGAAILADPKHLLTAFAKIQRKRSKAAEPIIIRVNSHRARSSVVGVLSNKQPYFSWHYEGEFYRATQEELLLLRASKIKGWNKSRRKLADLSKCWSFNK